MMSRADILEQLIGWFSQQCNGLWEHGSGVTIESLDNPGWSVKINLRETPFEFTQLDEINLVKGDNNWIQCFKKDGDFIGAGDLSKLPAILEYFLTFVGR